MGSSASKPASSASQAIRKYPTRPSRPARTAAPKATPKAGEATSTSLESNAPDAEAATNSFSKRLHDMGIVDPNPTFSLSSTVAFNPDMRVPRGVSRVARPGSNHTLAALERRRELQRLAEAEVASVGQKGYAGREFLDIGTIARVLALLQAGEGALSIEKQLKLKSGVVDRLRSRGTIALA
jgi:hypothetical protein